MRGRYTSECNIGRVQIFVMLAKYSSRYRRQTEQMHVDFAGLNFLAHRNGKSARGICYGTDSTCVHKEKSSTELIIFDNMSDTVMGGVRAMDRFIGERCFVAHTH